MGDQGEAPRLTDRPIGEQSRRESVGLFSKVLLQEVLAIGLVGLATALIVTLITWIATLIG